MIRQPVNDWGRSREKLNDNGYPSTAYVVCAMIAMKRRNRLSKVNLKIL